MVRRDRGVSGPPPPAANGAEAGRHLPRELDPTVDAEDVRRFAAEGGEWLAWIAGRGVGGTGSYNLALLEAIHFARAERPTEPVREALVGRGTYQRLSDAELAELLRRARQIAEPRG